MARGGDNGERNERPGRGWVEEEGSGGMIHHKLEKQTEIRPRCL